MNIRNTLLKRLCVVMAFGLPIALANCSKDDDNKTPDTPIVEKSVHDVYVAVTYDSVGAFGHHTNDCAGYYHNGAVVPLSGQATGVNTYANDIFVDGYDVYVAGQEGSSPSQAVYWKNGEVNYLPEGSNATSVVVKNGNVYICGYEATNTGDQACCWVNNNKYKLDYGTRATGIAADDAGHVYVVGYYSDRESGRNYMRYWTDAETNSIYRYGINCDYSCDGWAICLDNSHQKNGHPFICLGGKISRRKDNVTSHVLTQWVERKETPLATAFGNDLYAMSACNGKLYSCGNDAKVAKYWVTTIGDKGEGNDLQSVTLSDGSTQWYATGISVVEDDAYVCGYDVASISHSPTVWKNGAKFINMVSNVRIIPNAICVVARKQVNVAPSDSTATKATVAAN